MQSCDKALDLTKGFLNFYVIARVKVKYLDGVEPKSFFRFCYCNLEFGWIVDIVNDSPTLNLTCILFELFVGTNAFVKLFHLTLR
jgi:hypothetical protein